MSARSVLVLVLALCAPAPALALQQKPELGGGTERYSFVDALLPERTIEVHTYRSNKARPDDRVLFVMHGMNRNAAEYRDAWISMAIKYRLLLVVPEFDKTSFPGSREYNCGNLVDSRGRAKPASEWSFTAIERIFDDLRERAGVSAERYYLYGHSAGAQFVHRMLLQLPEARIERAVSANAGSYSLVSFEDRYPYGLLGGVATPESAARSLGMPLVVLLGKQDTDQHSSSLPRGEQAMAQGPHRLARGQFFFEGARDYAAAHELEFAWTLELVSGVGHSNGGMARSAARALFD